MKWNFVKYFGDIVAADGKKRGAYALTNILYVLCAALCAWGIVALADYNGAQAANCTDGGMVLLSWLGLLACIAGAIEFFAIGVLSQVILLVCCLIALFDAEKRSSHILPLIVSILTLVALVVAFCIIVL